MQGTYMWNTEEIYKTLQIFFIEVIETYLWQNYNKILVKYWFTLHKV